MQGNSMGHDRCMAVGVCLHTCTRDHFSNNGNGYDAPRDDRDWPNMAYNVDPAVLVWLR